ncbi:MAG: hypothetical protein LBB13_00410 [Rickettsiales bacterium]|nr:hypothetical protein [Rickettsiales bacterium]
MTLTFGKISRKVRKITAKTIFNGNGYGVRQSFARNTKATTNAVLMWIDEEFLSTNPRNMVKRIMYDW